MSPVGVASYYFNNLPLKLIIRNNLQSYAYSLLSYMVHQGSTRTMVENYEKAEA